MSYFWFLKLIVKCLDHCAWPVLALGYPLCASVQAIETNSYRETKDLISYWILLSLIYILEYVFSGPLEWNPFWPYTKLMIIFWLVVPDFGRASYAYNNIIRTCLSNPEAIIRSFNNWRKSFVKKDNFLVHAERYLEEYGTEALMKLIASKTNGEEIQTEHKATKDSEVIVKKEIPTDIQVKYVPVVRELEQSENGSASMLETVGTAAMKEVGESSTQKEVKVQKEWTCALCHVTTSSEKTLNSHLQGSKHLAMLIGLKTKNQPVSQKNLQKKPAGVNIKEVICEICNVKCPCEITFASHRNGKKHLAKVQSLF
ncbi:uncharacterized protein T19C3.4-like isoform X1 [Vigna unguiculata]|uniref:uncharacterized protein T19C3.4-like isoform X1 n=1 Tax=Vigna unguiculata TaxID=3917 RepID=UPI0010170F3E|nr:uncharacterized protein T19C3.4-like isoform X1 [Vigna unguiculata]